MLGYRNVAIVSSLNDHYPATGTHVNNTTNPITTSIGVPKSILIRAVTPEKSYMTIVRYKIVILWMYIDHVTLDKVQELRVS